MFCHSGHILAAKLRHWVSTNNKYDDSQNDGTHTVILFYNLYQLQLDSESVIIYLNLSTRSREECCPLFNLECILYFKSNK